jgi:hypothetical protein
MTEESDFIKYRPLINEITIVQAAQSWGISDEILSLNGRRTAMEHFVLLLANDSFVLGPYLLNSTCASALCGLLLAEGFGPPAT